MPFDALDASIALRDPRWLSDVSAWVEHIPFAFAAMEMLRPRVLVELGTHKGDSYLAFCQAIAELQLPTHCFAVDTWSGDSQAGRYGQTVLRTLRLQHDPLYGSFSTIIQTTFDDALTRFDNSSIDVLHIDGLHTFDAVKHDFEAWLPKLSPQGVVFFHDTAVREGDFGVYRLWAQLAAQYPHFEFVHGYGLGILAVGGQVPERFLNFCRDANQNPAPVRQFFATLGQRLEIGRALRLITDQLGRQLEVLNQWRTATNQPALVLPAITRQNAALENFSPVAWQNGDLKHYVDQLHESLLNLSAAVGDVVTDDANIRTSCRHLTQQVQDLTRHGANLQELNAQLRQQEADLQRVHQQTIATLQADLAAAHAQIHERNLTLETIHRSRMWRWARQLARLPLLGKYVEFPEKHG